MAARRQNCKCSLELGFRDWQKNSMPTAEDLAHDVLEDMQRMPVTLRGTRKVDNNRQRWRKWRNLLAQCPPDVSSGNIFRFFQFKKKCSGVNTASCLTWRQTTAAVVNVNRTRPSSHCRCYQLCCKQGATLATCCSQSSSVVLTVDYAKVES